MLEKGRHQIAVNLSLQDGETRSLIYTSQKQNFNFGLLFLVRFNSRKAEQYFSQE